MRTPIRSIVRCCLALLLVLSSRSQAVPPPELTVLRQQYEKAFAERVTTVHEASLASLNAKFTTALDNASAQAKSAGDLPTVLAIQGDKKLLAEQQPLPADDDKTPEPLKKLRAIYRDQLAKLTEQQTALATALLTPYASRLKELEATLTKADRIEEAQDVLTYREGLKAEAPPPPAMTATAAPPAASVTPPAVAVNLPKGDDRAAAEWLLTLGAKVRVTGDLKDISAVADLPKGRFSLSLIQMPSPMPQVADADFDKLANLDGLHRFTAGTPSSQTDDAYRFLATCPNLTHIDIQNGVKMTGRWLTYLAPLQQLEFLLATSSCRSDVSGLALIPKDKLYNLHLRATAVTTDTLKVLAGFKNLQILNLRATKISDDGMAALAVLTKLELLDVAETSISVAGLRPLAKLPLTTLAFGLSPADLTTAGVELGVLFPKIENLNYPPGTVSAADLAAVAKTWPKLKNLGFSSPSTFADDAFATVAVVMPNLTNLSLAKCKNMDVHVAGIAKHKKLTSLRLNETDVTDACLPLLQTMRALKSLELGKTKVTDAGAAAFKKARPDVDVKR